MKMIYNGTPVKSLNVHHYELNTNDATVIPSDLQSGVTCYAKGKKVTGTGKSFEFAYYGATETNRAQYIPNDINVVEISSVNYPIQLTIALNQMEFIDFSISQVIGRVIIDNVSYDISIQAANNILTVSCDKQVTLQIFYGKDNYV